MSDVAVGVPHARSAPRCVRSGAQHSTGCVVRMRTREVTCTAHRVTRRQHVETVLPASRPCALRPVPSPCVRRNRPAHPACTRWETNSVTRPLFLCALLVVAQQ